MAQAEYGFQRAGFAVDFHAGWSVDPSFAQVAGLSSVFQEPEAVYTPGSGFGIGVLWNAVVIDQVKELDPEFGLGEVQD